MVEWLEFPSGIKLVFNRFKDSKSVSVGIWIKKGARFEPLKYKGISHFLEHLLFKGSRNYSYKEIKQEIEGRGGQLNAFTSQELVCYFAKVLEKNADKALDVLSDMVSFPLLKSQDIEKERTVILEEIKMYKDMPSSRVSSLLDSLLWEDHPLGIDVIGSEQTVRRISRQDLLGFKNNLYQPSNILVAISARELPSSFKKAVKKLSLASSEKKSQFPRFPQPKIKKMVGFKQEVTSFEQTHLSLGLGGFSYFDQRRFILEIINVILGGNMSSRLFEAIREKQGLAYEVSSYIKKYRDSGAFIIHCALEEKNVELAFKIILKEINRLKKNLVPKSELSRAKDYLLGNFSMGLESTLNSMFYVGESACILGKVLEYKQIEDNVLRVSPEDIRRVCRELFSFSSMKIALVTKRKESFFSSFKEIINRNPY